VHFSCDVNGRPNLGVFKDYVKGNGKTFLCPSCSGAKRARTDE
jgi:hypothetical protein